jgi:hypothetical protein
MIEFFDETEYGIHRSYVRIGTVIRTPFLVDGSCLEDARKEFVGDADAGVGFAVLQKDIVTRVIFLDERVLK